MAKLWDKGFEPDEMIERFTVGDDRRLDMRLAKYDVEGSMAHIRMLETSCGRRRTACARYSTACRS